MTRRHAIGVWISSLVLAWGTAQASAGTIYTWKGGSGSWGAPTNWIPNGTPGPGDIAVFVPSAPITVTLDGDRTLGNEGYVSFQSNSEVTLAPGTGGSLTALSVTTSADHVAAHRISCDMVAPVDFSVSLGTLLTVSGTISGSGGVRCSGAGAAELSGTNTYTGTTMIVGGTLLVGADAPAGVSGALGNAVSAVLLGDASGTCLASLATNGAFTVGRDVTVRAGSTGTLVLGGNGASVSQFSGAIRIERDVSLLATAGTVEFTGAIDDGAGSCRVDKIGEGTVRLSGANGYGGETTVWEGTLKIRGDALPNRNGPLGNAASDVVVGGMTGIIPAAFLLDGACTIGRGVTVRSGSSGAKTIGGSNTSGTAVFSGTVMLSDRVTVWAAAGGTVEFMNRIQGVSGDLTKSGEGAVVFSRSSIELYTGAIQVLGGALILNRPAGVEGAVERGVRYLESHAEEVQPYRDHGGRDFRVDELVLWTLLHAGVPGSDPLFRRLFRKMTESELTRTYNVSLQAMILEEMDRATYQGRIAQCAQFLVDNQCANGQWSYGEPGASSQGGAAAESDGYVPGREKPAARSRVPVRKTRDGPATGDNSNSQYAALGMRACHDAGIILPQETLQRAARSWRSSQQGGGWCYCQQRGAHRPYGSMTAGAVGSLTIYAYILGEDWRTDKAIGDGLGWMARNFSVTENPGPPEGGAGGWYYYYTLYGLERAGILYRTESFGPHSWYVRGVEELLRVQEGEGSWRSDVIGERISDTCFAILFLRRATRPLVTGSDSR